MHKMLTSIIAFFESIGRARAASALVNAGYHDIAKSMMIDTDPAFDVHP
jgi:hypothetical protein